MNRWAVVFVLLLTLAFPAALLHAQDQGQVELATVIQKEIEVVNEKGETEIRLVEVGNAIPGDELIFTITYTNRGDDSAENIVLVNPVPEHTEYIGDSASGDGTDITFSADGGGSYDLPVNLRISGEDGKPRTARPAEYTHIRWVCSNPLSPGNSGNVSFRVRLK